MNCKLGGTPWMTEIPGNNIMVIGFDVCHDTTDKSKSYGAMVATMDMKKSSNFFSAVSAHRNGEELSDHFALNVCKAIKQYHTEHGSLPDRILIYRDGVGEGQTDYVYQHETKVLISRLNEVYKKAGNLTYRLAFTIVSKRINSRFFKKGGMNPDPGTVIDDVVTLPERYCRTIQIYIFGINLNKCVFISFLGMISSSYLSLAVWERFHQPATISFMTRRDYLRTSINCLRTK